MIDEYVRNDKRRIYEDLDTNQDDECRKRDDGFDDILEC